MPARLSVHRRSFSKPSIHAGVRSITQPFPAWAGAGTPFAGDVVVVAQLLEQIPPLRLVVAAIEMPTHLLRQRSGHLRAGYLRRCRPPTV